MQAEPEFDGPEERRRPRQRLRRRPRADAARADRPDERPYARLSILWAVVLVVASIVGPLGLALLTAPVALIAAASALRINRRDVGPAAAAPTGPAGPPAPPTGPAGTPAAPTGPAGTPHAPTEPLGRQAPPDPRGDSPGEVKFFGQSLAATQIRTAVLAGVVLVPFVAAAGALPAVVAAALVVGLAVAAARPVFGCPPLVAALAVGAPVAASGAVVVARGQGFAAGFVLVAATCLYDAASCLMGRRPTGGFLGVTAGLATMVVLGFLVKALADPPFAGAAPWAMCLMAALLGWLGAKVCRLLVRGGPSLPALGRLDSLAIAGPVWVVVVATVLHR